VLLALILLNVVELVGALLVSPGFWIGVGVGLTLLIVDLVYLRQRAVVAARRQAVRRRKLAWIAAEQALVRQQQARRASERRALQRQVAAERHRAPVGYVEHYARRAARGS